MYRFILALVLLSSVVAGNIAAQRVYTDIFLPTRSLPLQTSLNIDQSRWFPASLQPRRLPYFYLENPAMRYVLQNLENAYQQESETRQALVSLTHYVKNMEVKYATSYLMEYGGKNIGNLERAISMLEDKVASDTILDKYMGKDANGIDRDADLLAILQYIRQDSNYIWLRNASRDSVMVEVSSLTDKPIKIWIDNGRSSFYRFFAHNRLGDTIGTWIQVVPGGKKMKLYTDEDVVQHLGIETKSQNEPEPLYNPLDSAYYALASLHPGELVRRYWTYYSEVEVSMSQGKLANWASGGENSVSLVSNLRYFWNYNRNRTSWENWVHYRFGFMKNGDEEIRKNEDRFELNSKLGLKAFKHWYYSAQFNMVTQLFNSYEYPKDVEKKLVANFMSPGHFTISLGMDFKPNDNFSLMISPIAGKWNFVRDTSKIDAGRYGIESGKRFKRIAGAQVNAISRLTSVFDFMDIYNECNLFMSYENQDKFINSGTEEEKKKHIPLTASWKMTLSFRINDYMNASVYTETIYDENYSRKLQFKERLNLGVKFRF